MVVVVKSSRAGKKRRGKFLANGGDRGDFYCTQGCVAEPLGRRAGDGGSLG